MKPKSFSPRIPYFIATAALLLVEVCIALFVRDAFIRPYGGDILVTALLCCLGRCVLLYALPRLPLWVCLFAFAVEAGQYFHMVSRLGLEGSLFFRTLLGTSFSHGDLLCYATGCILFWGAERGILHMLYIRKKKLQRSSEDILS